MSLVGINKQDSYIGKVVPNKKSGIAFYQVTHLNSDIVILSQQYNIASKIMAFRATEQWKSMAKGLRGLATSTTPRMQAYAAPAELQNPGSSSHGLKWPPWKGDFVPVYVAVGLIALSTTFGLYSATLQLRHGPNVFVRKKRRETIPEVVEPEHVLEDAEELVKKSLFRKLAHLQDPEHNYVVKDRTRGDAFAHPILKAETLKDVGVEPLLPSPYD